MQRESEPLPLRARVLYNMSAVALLLLILVPCYLVLNQFWKSLLTLATIYGVMGLIFLRLGRYMRRVMRRLPAEIPPWRTAISLRHAAPSLYMHFSAAEAIRSGCKDPHYLQNVLKPRLQKLLVYRAGGGLDTSLEALDVTRLLHVDPAVLDFLQRREPTGLWAGYCRRRQRAQDVLTTLRHIEAL